MFFLYIFLLFPLDVSFGSQKMMRIPVLKIPLALKSIIQKEHLTERVIPEEKITSQIFTKSSDIIGQEIRSSCLKAGAVIRLGDIKKPTLVKRGEMVRIIYQTPKFKIMNQGIAQKEGVYGETISVEIQNSKKKVFGRISNKQEIRVDLA